MSKILIDDQSSKDFDNLYLYRRAICLLEDIKILEGPVSVSSTLKRHPKLKKFIVSHMKDDILELEGKISDT